MPKPDQTNAVLIGGLDDQDFLEKIKKFMLKVRQFKEFVKLTRVKPQKKRKP
ncbi:MAG: hypothetical protein WBG50_26150 [Desulfomonilaceae bacterium]